MARITLELLNNTLDSLNRLATERGVEPFSLLRQNGTVELVQVADPGIRSLGITARGSREVYLSMTAMREAWWLLSEVG